MAAMPKYEINKMYNSNHHKQTVDATKYVQEGEFFVFYGQGAVKVLTVAAPLVKSVDTIEEK